MINNKNSKRKSCWGPEQQHAPSFHFYTKFLSLSHLLFFKRARYIIDLDLTVSVLENHNLHFLLHPESSRDLFMLLCFLLFNKFVKKNTYQLISKIPKPSNTSTNMLRLSLKRKKCYTLQILSQKNTYQPKKYNK